MDDPCKEHWDRYDTAKYDGVGDVCTELIQLNECLMATGLPKQNHPQLDLCLRERNIEYEDLGDW